MTIRKEFGAAQAEQNQESIEVVLGAETFVVHLPLPGTFLLEMARAANEIKEGDSSPEAGIASLTIFDSLLAQAFGEQAYEKFKTVATQERVGIETFVEIVTWIISEASGRPTQQQPGLQAPLSQDGLTSEGAAS